jgi:hypothetical protein
MSCATGWEGGQEVLLYIYKNRINRYEYIYGNWYEPEDTKKTSVAFTSDSTEIRTGYVQNIELWNMFEDMYTYIIN